MTCTRWNKPVNRILQREKLAKLFERKPFNGTDNILETINFHPTEKDMSVADSQAEETGS